MSPQCKVPAFDLKIIDETKENIMCALFFPSPSLNKLYTGESGEENTLRTQPRRGLSPLETHHCRCWSSIFTKPETSHDTKDSLSLSLSLRSEMANSAC